MLADGLEHLVASAVQLLELQHRLQQRLVHQLGQQHRHVSCLDRQTRADADHRIQSERRTQHRRAVEQLPRRVGQRVHTPGDRVRQRPLMRRTEPPRPRQQPEPVVQRRQDRLHRQRPGPRGRELQSQWQPVQPLAEPRHERRVLRRQREVRANPCRPPAEQLDRRTRRDLVQVPVVRRYAEHLDPAYDLIRQAEGDPRSHQYADPGETAHHPVRDVGHSVENVLGVVLHDHQVARLPAGQHVVEVRGTGCGAERVEDRRRYCGVALHCGQVHDDHRGIRTGEAVRRGQRELGLPDPTRSDQSHQPVLPEELLQLEQLRLTTDQAVRDRTGPAPAQTGRGRIATAMTGRIDAWPAAARNLPASPSRRPRPSASSRTESLRASDPARLELTDRPHTQSGAVGQLLLGEPCLDPQVEQEIGEAQPVPQPDHQRPTSPVTPSSLTVPAQHSVTAARITDVPR